MEPSQCSTLIQPRRLKDFLQDQNLTFPHYSRKSTISRHFSILRRTISRRFCNKNKSTSPTPEPAMKRTTSVTVKDILRWRSFRDLADPVENNVSEFTVESPRFTATTTTTTTSTGTPRSSWCDSDFTVDDDSPVCFRGFSGETKGGDKKNFRINVVVGERITKDTKDAMILEEEKEQFSPISVLDFTQEHEETFSPFHQILADMERKNIMLKQQIRDSENLIEVDDDLNKDVELNDTESFIIEEKAIQLMDHVKTASNIEDLSLDCLLLDFFRDELITNKEVKNNGKLESRVLNVVKSWVRGENDGFEWEMECRKHVCIREMDKRWSWKDFEDDQKEIVIEIEKIMLNQLLDELSTDLVNV